VPQFTSIEYRNIQSVGNHPIKIHLDKSSTTLIGGLNGAGKSTFLFAFSYGLFGKFPSGTKLADAINSVNKKNLLVKVSFTERGDEYTVVRGEKPKKFEIYKNDELMNQHAHARDQQKLLEVILGMDFKVFTQIVMLNKERYVPFMEMNAGDRRKIVEDILGISIFSYMNEIVKEKIKQNKTDSTNIENDLRVKETELSGQKKLIQQIQASIASKNKDTQDKYEQKESELKFVDHEIEQLEREINQIVLTGHDKVKKQKREYENLAVEFDTKIKQAKKNSSFFQDNDHCPTCGQDITSELKEEKQHECDEEVKQIQNVVAEMLGELEKVISKNDQFEQLTQEKLDLQSTLREKRTEKKSIDGQIKDLIEDSQNGSNGDELQDAVTYYEQLEQQIEAMRESLEQSLRYGEQLEMMRNLLKDDGIKSVIISEYIAIINKKINEYLQAMDFYINMTLDENFKESFGAMHKEKFTMNNLSTGQKTRVNIAIWLALLEVASIKNSVVSNVLMLDEILEPVDAEGIGHVMNLFREKLQDKNIFVITQRFDEFEDLFRSSIKFKLNHGFTEIV